MVDLACLRILHKGQAVRFIGPGDPRGKAFAIGQVAHLGHKYVQHFAAAALGLGNVGGVQLEMIQPQYAPAAELFGPDIRVAHAGGLGGQRHVGIGTLFTLGAACCQPVVAG